MTRRLVARTLRRLLVLPTPLIGAVIAAGITFRQWAMSGVIVPSPLAGTTFCGFLGGRIDLGGGGDCGSSYRYAVPVLSTDRLSNVAPRSWSRSRVVWRSVCRWTVIGMFPGGASQPRMTWPAPDRPRHARRCARRARRAAVGEAMVRRHVVAIPTCRLSPATNPVRRTQLRLECRPGVGRSRSPFVLVAGPLIAPTGAALDGSLRSANRDPD